jgi:hypothetical protein
MKHDLPRATALRLSVSALVVLLQLATPGARQGAAQPDRASDEGVACEPLNRPDAIGLWAIPEGDAPVPEGTSWLSPGHLRIGYDGTSVTLRLFREHEWMWHTPDDVYRLSCWWANDDLWARLPFGTWVVVAQFRDGRFQVEEQGHTWVYERQAPTCPVPPETASFVLRRPLHDYGVAPTDASPPAIAYFGLPVPGAPDTAAPFPGLYVREGDAIVDAPEPDVRLARSYRAWPEPGPAADGLRLTLMTARPQVEVGETVRVLHVVEVVDPARQVWVMGPKPAYAEYLDGALMTPLPETPEYPWVGLHDGAVLEGPGVDYNFDVSSYRLDTPGLHFIQWCPGGASSNLLVIEALPPTEPSRAE